jgi:NDP-sugar pyrophosphorylase family protein
MNAQSPQVTRAVLLAAGRGTRMRDLTESLPKPMLPVHGKPILEHIIEGLKNAGISDVLIVVGYRADVVTSHFGDGSAHGVKIQYVTQLVQDGTGRVVDLAKEFTANEPFILSYGDILIDPENYKRLTLLNDSAALVSVKHNESEIAKGGCVVVNTQMVLTDLIEKPAGTAPSPWYNAGVYTFTPSIYAHTAKLERSPRGEFELTDAIRTLAQETGTVLALELKGEWADVRDPEILAELNASR